MTLAAGGIAGVTLTEDDMKRTGEAGRLAGIGKPSATTVPSERHKKGPSSHQRIVFAIPPEAVCRDPHPKPYCAAANLLYRVPKEFDGLR